MDDLYGFQELSIEELTKIDGGATGDGAYRLGQASALAIKASLGVLSILFLF